MKKGKFKKMLVLIITIIMVMIREYINGDHDHVSRYKSYYQKKEKLG